VELVVVVFASGLDLRELKFSKLTFQNKLSTYFVINIVAHLGFSQALRIINFQQSVEMLVLEVLVIRLQFSQLGNKRSHTFFEFLQTGLVQLLALVEVSLHVINLL
jgi:hypothetical protein